MRFHSKKNHVIDILFPISLYFVFAVSALTVLLLATNVYQTAIEHSTLNYTAETTLSYLTEKIHQNDTASAISVGTFDNRQALILKQTYNDTQYLTYIYVNDNNLMELYTKEGSTVSAESGKIILPLKSLDMEMTNSYTVHFTCTDTQDNTLSSYVNIHSES